MENIAGTLNCPMCGAAAATDSTRCQHCGARLATIACPSCFGMIFSGAKFCSHCGARAVRRQAASAEKHPCPRCKLPLAEVSVGGNRLLECSKCEGVWADAAALDQICNDRERQAAVLGMAVPAPASTAADVEKTIRYVPCPVCRKLMNRVNFARCSNVVVDVCKSHGTWMDRDELRRVVDFIRAGGIDRARAKEMAELERRQRDMAAAQRVGAWDNGPADRLSAPGGKITGLSALAAALADLLRE